MASLVNKKKTGTDTPGTLVHGELGFTQNKLFYGNQAAAAVEVVTVSQDQTFTAIKVAQSNTSYTTRQIRNVILSTANPSGGSNGDIWIKYTP